eukprot:TRINITY_DN1353_c0_g1::TRINITY_DN1353_c0_g1_i1::g.20104::m.20104 TRINITY_DN1353_c0_g1::TRINITY_DN1353_c0_g1_i1::g.20104  ORF type:complete len:514 (+),score=164.96,sp/A6UVT6/LADH_META3/35.06/7e-92,Aldedh/PF00171.17/2.9e-138 TRINITY_DN1353_c0_g1_i1:64-1542(+)
MAGRLDHIKGKILKNVYPYYLASKPVFANEGLAVTDKMTGEVVCRVAVADAKAIDAGISAAHNALGPMQALPSYKRKGILMHVVSEVRRRFDEISLALCVEAGKPLKDARGEVTRLIDTFEIAAEESVRIYGEFSKLDISARCDGFQSLTRRFPVGVVSMISPFNFPLNLTAHKVAPAIAAGCPFVLKPASRTPIGALIIGEILAETDLPEGAFSILPCSRDGADLFTTDPRLKLISFTGSPEVGWKLKEKAGKKKVVLELGGNAACIVDETVTEAEKERIVQRIIFGAFYQSGQSCISLQRLYVHESHYDDLVARLAKAASELKKGDPLDVETFIGPMIAESEAVRLETWINNAVAKGAKVLVGGKREGVYLDATIMTDVPRDTEIYAEEAFGPVFVVEKFSDFKSVVESVNDSKFGLQAGVFTNNMHRAFYAFEHCDVGGVVINDVPSVRVDSQPYGGVKDSGIGREGIRYAIEDMTELRVMLMKDMGKI